MNSFFIMLKSVFCGKTKTAGRNRGHSKSRDWECATGNFERFVNTFFV